MFTSYAQNFEDVMLWRGLKHIKNGFYIDVGAQHPVIDSVSMAFYEHGWRGVHVEPSIQYAQLLRESRPDEVVIQAALSDTGGVLTFYNIADTGMSTCDAEIAKQHKASEFNVNEISVSSITLADVFKLYEGREIHWLKIDVEGLEAATLRGWRPSKARPWIVVVESTLPLTQIEAHDEWEQLIIGLNYQFVYFDGLNRYYISKKHPELKDAFCVGPNIFDDFVLNAVAQGQAEIQRLQELLVSRDAELGTQIVRGQAEIQRLLVTLAAVYDSNSWSLTYPLRKLRSGALMTSNIPRCIARFILQHALAYIQNNLQVKMTVSKVLSYFPKLKACLEAFVRWAEARSIELK